MNTPEEKDDAVAQSGLNDGLGADKRDAERYRWLRNNKNAYPLFFIAQRDPNNIVVQFTGELADMNIDELMAANVELTGRVNNDD